MVKSLLLLPAVLVLAWRPAPVGSPIPQKDTGGSEKSGVSARVKQIYKIDCAMCHGDTGDGKTDLGQSMGVNNDFGDPKVLASMSDQQLFDVIRKGKDKMPPEDGPRATDDQIKGLVIYIRTFSTNRPAPTAEPASQPAAAPAPAASSPSSN